MSTSPTVNHWQSYARRWQRVRPPLRPPPEVAARIAELADADGERVLLLGVTPELAQAFASVDAVDHSEGMIAQLWPGDAPGRRAILGDWLDRSVANERYAAVVGDGSLNNLQWPQGWRSLLQRLPGWLGPGASFVCRLFERPTPGFGPERIAAVLAGQGACNFHAFKWMLAMELAEAGGAMVPVQQILDRFQALCPDRGLLAARTGWALEDIATIDVYAGSTLAFSFPNRAEVLSSLPEGFRATLHACGDYELAACCPILQLQAP